MSLDLHVKLEMCMRYVSTVDVLLANYQNVSSQKRIIIFPREYLRFIKSLHVFNEIERSSLSDRHTDLNSNILECDTLRANVSQHTNAICL